MLTRCPQCKTIYRLTPLQLEAAGGQVRCSRCRTVFNAEKQLKRSSSKAKPAEEAAPAPVKADSTQPASNNSPGTKPDRPRSKPTPQREEPPIGTVPYQLLNQGETKHSTLWWLLLFFLTLSALLQLAWLERHSLVADPQGNRFLTGLCQIVGCTLPQQRAINKIKVLSRDIASHPSEPHALQFRMVMSNQAAFAQPYPHLQLKLFDANRRLAGQRVFAPREYLGDKLTPLLEPDNAIYVNLDLLDPGPNISGFEINFL